MNNTSKMQKLVLTIGIPGSGKTTWAMRQLRDKSYRRANRDDIRALIGDSSLSLKSHFEKEVTKMQQDMILNSLRKGYSVLVDDTNLTAKAVNGFKDLIQDYCNQSGKVIGLETKTFPVELKTCIQRDKDRDRTVGEDVIKKMHKRYVSGVGGGHIKDHYEAIYPLQADTKQDINLPKCIISDLDGTLCLLDDRDPYNREDCEDDRLNEPVANTIKAFHEKGYKIFLFSGRSDAYKQQTVNWLEAYEIPYDKLIMRQEGDVRKDSILKEEIFRHHVLNDYYVEFILDDRNQVVDKWRSMGLNVFQVNYGDF